MINPWDSDLDDIRQAIRHLILAIAATGLIGVLNFGLIVYLHGGG